MSILSGHLLIAFEGRGINSIDKTINTIIGHKYRFVYPTNWTVSDSVIESNHTVFVLRTVDDSTYKDVEATRILKEKFSGKSTYVDYVATTTETNIWLRADSGNHIEFDVIDLSAENIAANTVSSVANTENISALINSKYIPILGSCKFGVGILSERATMPVFLKGQELLSDVEIVGVFVEIKIAGTIVLTKCSDYLKISSTFETIQTYDVKVGLNYLPITSPITLDGTNAIGISEESTASYTRIPNSLPGNLHYTYFNATNNTWIESTADIVMALMTNSLTYLETKFTELDEKLSGHLPIPFEGKGIKSVDKTINTIIGHKYRFVYPTNWSVSDSAIDVGNVVFVLRTVDGSTTTDVEATKIFKRNFNNKDTYVDYVATTTETNIWLRADSGNHIEFDVIDLSAENIAANTVSIKAIKDPSKTIEGTLKTINILGSARFSTNQHEVGTSAVFIHDQSLLIDKTIIGLLVNVYSAGTAVLCKCTNYRAAQTPVIETLKTFNVDPGINYLFLDTPITLQDGEAFGWSSDSTAAYYKGGYDSSYNKGYYYYNNGWQKSGADLSMAVLTNDLSKLIEERGLDSTARTQASVGQINSQWPNSSFQAHLFIDKIDRNSDVLIPSQSVFDIDIAYRLGFKVFELNTQITADGDGVCMHGVSGALGYQVTDLNGEFHPEVKFADLTLAQLQSNYVYRSSMAKYRVPITDIDTALRELKKRNMIPFTSGTANANVLSKIQSVFGNNYIAYSGSRNTVGGGVPICNYSGISTKAAIISQCETIGSPYIHSFSHGAIMAIYKSNASEYSGTDMTEKTDTELVTYFKSLSESQKIELINLNKEWFRDVFYEIHKRNCYVSWAPCYEFEGTNQLFLSLGVDCTGGSDKHVPDFSCGNICNYSALFDFSEFSHNGSEQDGVLTLTAGQSITVNGSTQELTKGSLHVRYIGTANVSIGHKGASDIVSDGKETMVFTSYFLNSIPTFVITAITTVRITEISWRSSKC